MTIIFVDDTKTGGADTGIDWDNAFLSLDNPGVDGAAAGSEIRVASTHDETITGISLDFSLSTDALPITMISMTAGTTNYAIGAKITTTGTSDVNCKGRRILVYGMEFVSADDILLGLTFDGRSHFEDCVFNASDLLSVGAFESHTRLVNCTINSDHTAAWLIVGGESRLELIDCIVTHANSTTMASASDNTDITLECCDLSAHTSFVFNPLTTGGDKQVRLRRCVMKSSWAFASAVPSTSESFMIAEDSIDGVITLPVVGGTVKRMSFEGEVEDVATPDRTGGSEDGFNGLYSRKMSTNGNAIEQYTPLRSGPMSIRLTTNTSPAPSGATSLDFFATTRMAPQGSPSALTTDGTSTWNGSGVGTKQKITHTLSSQNAATLTVFVASGGTLNNDDFWVEIQEPNQVGGNLIVEAFLAKPSTVVYVDVRLDVA